MSRPQPPTVLGVDGCRGGWVGVLWDGSSAHALFSATLEELISQDSIRRAVVIGVDMPMGLPDEGARQADRLAQRELGRRASSIFVTPTRSALSMSTQALASAENKERGGPGVSIQAFNLRTKVLEADEIARRFAGPVAPGSRRLVEVHPELSFHTLNDGPLEHSKRTADGQHERRKLLARVGMDVDPSTITAPGKIASDDVVDAAAAAWSAWRVYKGTARSLPNPPAMYSDGISGAIWV